METLSEFLGQADVVKLIQIALDLFLICMLLVFIKKRSAPATSEKDQALVDSLEKVIAETGQIAAEFDTNLKRRQALIQQVLSKLDAQLEEAKRMADRLEALQHNLLETTPKTSSAGGSLEQQQILMLTRKGYDAENIAKRLKKPLGEVELILKLHRLSSS